MATNSKSKDKISTHMHETFSDINKSTRTKMVDLLNQQLVDTLDLHSQLKQAHWNVKGMNFIAVHELFDAVADAVLGFSDMIAERVTALGADAQGTSRTVASYSTLPELPSDLEGSVAFLTEVAKRIGKYTESSRKAIDTADEAGDMVTADLFTEVTREMDKQLYFVESHIQGN